MFTFELCEPSFVERPCDQDDDPAKRAEVLAVKKPSRGAAMVLSAPSLGNVIQSSRTRFS